MTGLELLKILDLVKELRDQSKKLEFQSKDNNGEKKARMGGICEALNEAAQRLEVLVRSLNI